MKCLQIPVPSPKLSTLQPSKKFEIQTNAVNSPLRCKIILTRNAPMTFQANENHIAELGGLNEAQQMMVEGEEMDVEEEDEEEDESYTGKICAAIKKYNKNPLELSTFATGGEIEGPFGVPAVHVDGVGRIAFPLCKEQTVTLLGVASQAPFGKGKETVVDVEVRRAWQINSNLVHINEKWLASVLPQLVSDSCKKLGVDAAKMDVRANLYKMLLYEEGGHFKKHRDTEKETGMFGSLLIQLPAEHEGGHLTVEHEKEIKRFPFDEESADKAYYTAFYADCEHTLEPVAKGRRLVLAYNLVRGVPSTDTPVGPISAAHRKDCEVILESAAQDWCAEDSAVEKYAVQKLALPLAHKYTHTNMTFAGLKGTDLSTLSLLQNAVHPETKQKFFNVYLALVTKRESGTSNAEPCYRRYRNKYGYDSDEESTSNNSMDPDSDVTTTYGTANWVGPDGVVELGTLEVDFDKEVITAFGAEDGFESKPDKKVDEGYCGNYAGTLEYWYHSAMLVFWPAEKDFEIKLSASLPQAVQFLQQMDRASTDFAVKLGLLLNFLKSGCGDKTWQLALVLPLTQAAEQVRTVLGLAHKTLTKTDHAAVVVEVSKHGWAALGDTFTALFRAQAPLVMMELLTNMKGAVAPQCSDCVVPLSAWNELVRILVDTTMQSRSVYHNTRSYAFMPYIERAYVGDDKKPIIMEKDWLELSRFVIVHCGGADQEAVAAHAGKLLSLEALNHLLQQLLPTTEGVFDGPFRATLRERAVQRCVDHVQDESDVHSVLEWVVRGQHVELATKLIPRLQYLCRESRTFHGLFALPVVHEVMQTDSVLSRELEGLVQARIAAVQPKAVPPPFSWRMKVSSHNTSDDARLGPFLAGDQESITMVGGFGGLPGARKFVTRLRIQGVKGVEFGTGQKAGVRLTKDGSHHQELLKRCAEFVTELNGLRKLIRVRDGVRSAPVDTSLGRRDDVIVIDSDGEEPAQKKTKVEPTSFCCE